MKLFYFFLNFILNYSLRVFYPRVKLVNPPKHFFGRTIYVSNHAASFMDPLVIASFSRPIVFFMTRSDIFTKVTRPFLWSVHMLPIYRQLDGEDTKKRNEEVFQRCSKILKYGRNLLIFGEGFTDDKFVRRLKPVKKGAVRIGFQALENINWSKNIHICALGVNYSDPSKMRSDILLSYSDKICLNDYKEAYLENPTKTITDLTKLVETLMQEQITHVQDLDLTDFHEQIMMITRKGMNTESVDASIPLVKRWDYSRCLALWLNKQSASSIASLSMLKNELNEYMTSVAKLNILDRHIFWKGKNGNRSKELVLMIILFPFMIIGLLHCYLPYLVAKRYTEKSFKRKVFWASVKVILGKLLIAIFNIPVVFLFYYLVYPSWWLSIGYFLTIGLTGLSAYMFFIYLREYKLKGKAQELNLESLIEKRNELADLIKHQIEVA